jgi:hypothetical protein
LAKSKVPAAFSLPRETVDAWIQILSSLQHPLGKEIAISTEDVQKLRRVGRWFWNELAKSERSRVHELTYAETRFYCRLKVLAFFMVLACWSYGRLDKLRPWDNFIVELERVKIKLSLALSVGKTCLGTYMLHLRRSCGVFDK